LAQQASLVTAVDFIEKFLEKNKQDNASFNNINYIHGDVAKLSFQINQLA
jgi:phosphoethanolamine N-methyltransferase